MTDRSSLDSKTGRLIGGRYRLDRLIATGGMAQVWEATDETLARKVAVKLLHPHLAADESFVARFRLEAVSAARLSHSAIVSIYDTCSTLYEKVAETNRTMIMRLLPRLFAGETPGQQQSPTDEPILRLVSEGRNGQHHDSDRADDQNPNQMSKHGVRPLSCRGRCAVGRRKALLTAAGGFDLDQRRMLVPTSSSIGKCRSDSGRLCVSGIPLTVFGYSAIAE